MRARKEERNQAIWEAVRAGRMQKDIAQDFGLSRGRVCKIYNEQDRRNAEKTEMPGKARLAKRILTDILKITEDGGEK